MLKACRVLAIILLALSTQPVTAAGFEVLKVEELQYPQYSFPNRLLLIEMEGPVEDGDATSLRAILDTYKFDPWFEFD